MNLACRRARALMLIATLAALAAIATDASASGEGNRDGCLARQLACTPLESPPEPAPTPTEPAPTPAPTPAPAEPAPTPSVPAAPPATPSPPASLPAADALSVGDVQRIASQAVGEAQARGLRATIAVVDRLGNVLLVFRMDGARSNFRIASGRSVQGGLEGIEVLPDSFAAISKAITGAYLSSNGNAFSTRTASQIIQEHFNPRERSQPGGPLFGVQFSQLPCSDLVRRFGDGVPGPQRSPLGLAADAGGLPLYKDGQLAGGIGVISDGLYSLDLNIGNIDADGDELVAVAGSQGFAAPIEIRANRITVDGRSLRYLDSESIQSNPAGAPAFPSLAGSAIAVPGYSDGSVRAGASYASSSAGLRADTGAFSNVGGYILVDATDANRFPPQAGSDGLLAGAEVSALLREAMAVANRARAQIRRPAGSTAQVTVTVVDTGGKLLGLVRSADAPVFGIDVALQKARSAAFFSNPFAAAALQSLSPVTYVVPAPPVRIGDYVGALQAFLGAPQAFGDGLAYSTRALGNLARPFFPDGIEGTENGPLSKPAGAWSVFSDGLQLDLAYNALVASAAGDPGVGCTGLAQLANGMQIFPGGVPVYRGSQLVGAVGVSGDGVDQDDMIAFLGIANASAVLDGAIGHAPRSRRADTLVPTGTGTRLRYVQCPAAPFNGSSEQDACAGL